MCQISHEVVQRDVVGRVSEDVAIGSDDGRVGVVEKAIDVTADFLQIPDRNAPALYTIQSGLAGGGQHQVGFGE